MRFNPTRTNYDLNPCCVRPPCRLRSAFRQHNPASPPAGSRYRFHDATIRDQPAVRRRPATPRAWFECAGPSLCFLSANSEECVSRYDDPVLAEVDKYAPGPPAKIQIMPLRGFTERRRGSGTAVSPEILALNVEAQIRRGRRGCPGTACRSAAASRSGARLPEPRD